MTSCLSFAKSSRCEFVSKALRLFNSQRSGRFVVAQQSVHLTLGILRQSQTVFYALAFFWLDGFAVPAPAQVTQAVGRQIWIHSQSNSYNVLS